MTAAMTAMLTTKANRPVRTIESQGTRDFSAISFRSNISANTYACCARQDQEAFCTRLRRGSSPTVRKGSSTLGSETLTIQESERAQVAMPSPSRLFGAARVCQYHLEIYLTHR